MKTSQVPAGKLASVAKHMQEGLQMGRFSITVSTTGCCLLSSRCRHYGIDDWMRVKSNKTLLNLLLAAGTAAAGRAGFQHTIKYCSVQSDQVGLSPGHMAVHDC